MANLSSVTNNGLSIAAKIGPSFGRQPIARHSRESGTIKATKRNMQQIVEKSRKIT